jgi:hypothetical protein
LTAEDVAIFLASTGIMSLVVLGLLYRFTPSSVPRTRQKFTAIVLRILFVHIAIGIVWCAIGNQPARDLIRPVLIYSAFSIGGAVFLRYFGGAADVLSGTVLLALAAALNTPWVVFALFVVWPEPQPPDDVAYKGQPGPPANVPELSGSTGTVIATLRPFGTVRLGTTDFPARSASGQLIPVGQEVVVLRREMQSLVVLPAPEFESKPGITPREELS